MPRSLLVIVTVSAVLGTSAMAFAFSTADCLAQKQKAAGKLQQCRAGERARVLQGKATNPAKCDATFADKIARLTQKGEALGLACRWADNGDGTTTDYDTGLVWEQKTDDGSVHDTDALHTWTATSGGTAADGTLFIAFLPTLNDCARSDGGIASGGFAGHCDWRLPTHAELQTIVRPVCGVAPCIDGTFGPTASNAYWTITSRTDSADTAWVVDFYNGVLTFELKDVPRYVRAVRGDGW